MPNQVRHDQLKIIKQTLCYLCDYVVIKHHRKTLNKTYVTYLAMWLKNTL